MGDVPQKRKQTQAGLKCGKTVLMRLQSLDDLFAQTAIQFTHLLLAALQQLRRTNPEQTLLCVLPEHLAFAPTILHAAQKSGLQVVKQLQFLVQPATRAAYTPRIYATSPTR